MQTEAPKDPSAGPHEPPSTVREERPLAVYVLSCFLGALLTGIAPAVGLFFVAYGAVVLKTRSHRVAAYLAVLGGAALCLFWGYETAFIALLLGAAAVFVGVHAFRGKHDQVLFFGGVMVLTLMVLGTDMFIAYLADTTVEGQIAAFVKTMLEQLTGAGTVPAEVVTVLKQVLPAYLNIWPSFYVLEGLVFCVVIYVAAYYAGERHHAEPVAKPLTHVDLSVHVLWVFLAALVCISVSQIPAVAHATLISALGYNLLVCSVAVFALQGYAVVGYGMRKAGWHWAVRLIVYLLMAQMELMFLLPSFVGLVDFWANFRKLPRESGSGSPKPDASA